MADANPVSGLLRSQYDMAHFWLEGTIEGMSAEQLHYRPDGLVLPAGANYAHAVVGEDELLSHMVAGRAPLCAGAWAGRVGLSEMPPPGVWDEWARSVQIDLAALRAYAQAVYASTDSLLAGMTDADLARPLDLTAMGLGEQTVGFLFSLMLGNAFAHTGEISAVKGVQGLKGYPF